MNKNPFPKSYKYEELIKIYSDIAIIGSYKKDGTFVPPSQLFGMSGKVKFKDILKYWVYIKRITSNSNIK